MSDHRATAATVVIADFTPTTSCDCSSLRRLTQLIGAGCRVQVYLSVKKAEGPPRPGHERMIRTAKDRQHG